MTKATKNWLLALVAAIVTPVAIYWLTPPRQTDADKPVASVPSPAPAPSPTPSPVASTDPSTYPWDGRVVDSAKSQLLANVEVSLAVAGATPVTDNTDSDGRFIFVVPRAQAPVVAVLKAAAAGYQVYTRNVTTDEHGVLERQQEIPLVPAPPPAPGTPAPTSLPKATLGSKAAAVEYHPRSMISARSLILPAAALSQR